MSTNSKGRLLKQRLHDVSETDVTRYNGGIPAASTRFRLRRFFRHRKMALQEDTTSSGGRTKSAATGRSKYFLFQFLYFARAVHSHRW